MLWRKNLNKIFEEQFKHNHIKNFSLHPIKFWLLFQCSYQKVLSLNCINVIEWGSCLWKYRKTSESIWDSIKLQIYKLNLITRWIKTKLNGKQKRSDSKLTWNRRSCLLNVIGDGKFFSEIDFVCFSRRNLRRIKCIWGWKCQRKAKYYALAIFSLSQKK